MESCVISDAQISASSERNMYHKAIQGRPNFLAMGGVQGGWSAFVNDQNQWLQADIGTNKTVTHLGTQGRNAANEWVTSYTEVGYSTDGASFHFYQKRTLTR